MYTTKPLSVYKKSPDAISIAPEGRNSGYLVLQDDESTPTSCFGLCRSSSVNGLPLPSNKLLSVESEQDTGESSYHTSDAVYLIPVINQPLSSNRYYAIKADGKHKGKAYACSKDEDKGTCCFCCLYVRDLKPRPLDPEDINQQFEFSTTQTCTKSSQLVAKPVAPDAYAPEFLRRKGWGMSTKTLKNFTLQEACGLDSSLRAHLPDLNFSISQQYSNPVVVGKWYCPFMFITEGLTEKDQIKNSVFYEMTLEQKWERIFTSENIYGQDKVVAIDVVVPTEVIRIVGREAVEVERKDARGVVWFRGGDEQVGLSSLIVERMIWEEERAGWVKEKEKLVRVVKTDEYRGVVGWRSFGCYVLVETFVLKRNDGSLVLTYDFRHTHQLRSKWE